MIPVELPRWKAAWQAAWQAARQPAWLGAASSCAAWLACACLGLALAPVARAQGPAACPPMAQAPSAEQLREGLAQARDRGFLWRLTKDGRTSWLYGTIHVGMLHWAFPGPTVSQALRASKTIALELDPTDPELVAQMQASVQAGRPLDLPSRMRDRLERQASAACVPKAALAGMHPVMQVVTYSVLVGRWDGLDPAWAQEAVLAGFARTAGQPIVSLETPQMQARLLIPEDPKEALTTVERSLLQLEEDRVRPMLRRMAGIWERGDMAELERYESWCECMTTPDERAAMRRLLDDRNPGLAEGISAMHALGGEVFAAVGALHMVGPTGLPRQLADKGFRVERVAFKR